MSASRLKQLIINVNYQIIISHQIQTHYPLPNYNALYPFKKWRKPLWNKQHKQSDVKKFIFRRISKSFSLNFVFSTH